MCGIFGLTVSQRTQLPNDKIEKILKSLFELSESRGKEASGVAFKTVSGIKILKSGLSSSQLFKSQEFISIKNDSLNEISQVISIIGHSRLVTNGRASLNINNQPVTLDSLVCIHNGIITNDKDISDEIKHTPISDLDTEPFINMIKRYSSSMDLSSAIYNTFLKIEGSASCAFLDENDNRLFLASNNGSLYYYIDSITKSAMFTSEHKALQKTISKFFNEEKDLGKKIKKVEPNSMIAIELDSLKTNIYTWNKNTPKTHPPHKLKDKKYYKIHDYSAKDYPEFEKLNRCTKCILPDTFPYISFDNDGVCNYCNDYKPQGARDHKKIKEIIKPYTEISNSYNQNCIVGLSGGRDSCYGVHYVKKELGLNPVAFTYDWGMVTDMARRNIFRMCGELGIEHILVSADIRKKRENVKKNIEAWLKKPELFMIPLFMAGDKQFYMHAHKLRKQLDIKLFMFGAGNTLETTDFKVGFANIKNNSKGGVLTQLSTYDKLKLIARYGSEFIKNPSYINTSILDTVQGFYSSYLLKDDYTYLYHHIPWIENEVEEVLYDEYGWEGATDTKTSWRVGDGTAAFYNYIYYTVAGFTEHDTFRSNQIREGMIDREHALELVKEENMPRWQTLEWYAKTIGFNIDDALLRIHKIPRLYK